MNQCTNSILMVRPAAFAYNAQTADSNAFQTEAGSNATYIQEKAVQEFDRAVECLKEAGIHVLLAEDSDHPIKPDALFPNNWVSFHEDGTVCLYPMLAPNRRWERRQEILDEVFKIFEVRHQKDLSPNEKQGQFLEGTGSIVFDHLHQKAYAALSSRTDKQLFDQFCSDLGYTPLSFHTKNEKGEPIYHTNVLLHIGEHFAVVCLDCIPDPNERALLRTNLTQGNRKIIELSLVQMHHFCGNVLELRRENKSNVLALSKTAFEHFSKKQKARIHKHCELLPIDVSTIECIGGGSIRCMMAEIFLPRKNHQ